MRIAVTSQNFRTVTNHAGRARRFIVFEAEAGGDLVEVERVDLPKEMSLHEAAHSAAAHPVDKIDVLVSASFGPGFVHKMAMRGVVASLSDETDPVAAVKDYLANGQKVPAPGEGCGEHDHGHGHGAGHHGDHDCGNHH